MVLDGTIQRREAFYSERSSVACRLRDDLSGDGRSGCVNLDITLTARIFPHPSKARTISYRLSIYTRNASNHDATDVAELTLGSHVDPNRTADATFESSCERHITFGWALMQNVDGLVVSMARVRSGTV